MGRLTKRAVVALPDSDRLDGFFDAPGTSRFQVFDAFDGRINSGDEYFDRAAFMELERREAKPAEVGCAISHYLLMREFAEAEGMQDDLMLVAEDDARPIDGWTAAVNRLISGRSSFDYVLLANPFDGAGEKYLTSISTRLGQLSWLARPIGGRFRVGHLRGLMRGTGFYLVSRQAARRYVEALVTRGERIGWCADTYEAWLPLAQIPQVAVEPNLAGWSGGSVIQEVSSLVFNSGRRERLAEGPAIHRLRSTLALRTRMDLFKGRTAATIEDLSQRLESVSSG